MDAERSVDELTWEDDVAKVFGGHTHALADVAVEE
jgi:hypothetical protein